MANKSLVTPIGRICFPQLFVPRAQAEGQEPRYSIVLLFSELAQKSPEYRALKSVVLAAATERFGAEKIKDPVFFRSLRMPFRPAGEKQYEGFAEGMTFITMRSKERPGIVDAQKQEITVPGDVWAGQLGRCYVNPFAYDVQGNRGVSFGLNHVQVTKRNEPRIDGRRLASAVFSEVSEEDGEEIREDANPW